MEPDEAEREGEGGPDEAGPGAAPGSGEAREEGVATVRPSVGARSRIAVAFLWIASAVTMGACSLDEQGSCVGPCGSGPDGATDSTRGAPDAAGDHRTTRD